MLVALARDMLGGKGRVRQNLGLVVRVNTLNRDYILLNHSVIITLVIRVNN